MTTRIKPKLIMSQTSAGYDVSTTTPVLTPSTNGWYYLDINYPTDVTRSVFISKNTADTITIEAQAVAFNKNLNAFVTVEALSVAVISAGVTNTVVTLAAPYYAIRANKTGTAGAATVIVVG